MSLKTTGEVEPGGEDICNFDNWVVMLEGSLHVLDEDEIRETMMRRKDFKAMDMKLKSVLPIYNTTGIREMCGLPAEVPHEVNQVAEDSKETDCDVEVLPWVRVYNFSGSGVEMVAKRTIVSDFMKKIFDDQAMTCVNTVLRHNNCRVATMEIETPKKRKGAKTTIVGCVIFLIFEGLGDHVITHLGVSRGRFTDKGYPGFGDNLPFRKRGIATFLQSLVQHLVLISSCCQQNQESPITWLVVDGEQGVLAHYLTLGYYIVAVNDTEAQQLLPRPVTKTMEELGLWLGVGRTRHTQAPGQSMMLMMNAWPLVYRYPPGRIPQHNKRRRGTAFRTTGHTTSRQRSSVQWVDANFGSPSSLPNRICFVGHQV